MFEKYFNCLLLLFFGIITVIPMLRLVWKMRLRYLQKLTRINVLRRQQKSEQTVLYSTAVLNECCRYLYSHLRQNKSVLALLTIGKIDAAITALSQRQPFLSMLLSAHKNAVPVYKKMLRQRKKWLQEEKYAVYFPILAQLCGDMPHLTSAVQKVSSSAVRKSPYFRYISAYVYLNEGDMLSASEAASAAQKQFKKAKYPFEEAACCLLLAETYRVSCVGDIAQTMIEAAIKTYQAHRLPLLHAKSIAMLGMLMLFENRTEEVEDKYFKALEIAPTKRLKADIYNQLTLFYIAQNKLQEAEKYAKLAFSFLKEKADCSSYALCLQLRGHIAFNREHYRQAEKYLNQSRQIYLQHQNYSAVAECAYLTAEALYKLQNYARSEAVLRDLLDLCHTHKNNFHSANAYSLLGLIYLKNNEHQRAKVLFQQSLHLEQSHERSEGLVSDYANLALIEQISGDQDAAYKNLQAALEYAQKSGDESLQKIIGKKIKSLS
ncbi:MAG: hypothetical protein J6Y91_05080 [Alphaproteobacteria bacterium]|nr:hypothetical protein [Alphaproteobacteria bacterium]